MENELKMQMYSVTLDCRRPHELAKFYAALLGWAIPFQDADFAVIAPPGIRQGAYPGMTFQRNDAYGSPVWPDEPEAQQQMAHVDIAVNDLDKAVGHAITCGATAAATQPSDSWRVMLDPAGHPFCLCRMEHIFGAGEHGD